MAREGLNTVAALWPRQGGGGRCCRARDSDETDSDKIKPTFVYNLMRIITSAVSMATTVMTRTTRKCCSQSLVIKVLCDSYHR